MASAKFQGNRFKIDEEIAENHAIPSSWLIIFNLTASIFMTLLSITCIKPLTLFRFILRIALHVKCEMV